MVYFIGFSITTSNKAALVFIFGETKSSLLWFLYIKNQIKLPDSTLDMVPE